MDKKELEQLLVKLRKDSDKKRIEYQKVREELDLLKNHEKKLFWEYQESCKEVHVVSEKYQELLWKSIETFYKKN